MTTSSFYTDGETYDTAVVTSNDNPASTTPSQAPSSFYPSGEQYNEADINVTTVAASAAQASATAAASSAAQAAASAASAAVSATTATDEAGLTVTSAQAAAASESNAASSASSASTSATNAASSASSAATSASTATTQATNASNSAAAASTSATNAASSASAASTSATNASSSATSAATSASNAASAVQSAAGTATPQTPGTAAVGTSTKWAHEDHVHPKDSTKADLNSPVFTGAPQGPTPPNGDNSTKLATTAFVLANAPAKNYVINGAMMVSQENGTTAGTANGYYPVDQFSIATTASVAFSAAQVSKTTPGGSPNRLRVTATSAATPAAGTYLTIRQKIEGTRIADLLFGSAAAKTITIRLGVCAPAGTYGVSVFNNATNRCYTGQFVIASGEANTDVVKQVVVAGDTTGTWTTDATTGFQVDVVLTSSGSVQTAPGSWGVPGGFFTNAQTNFFGTNGNIFELFDVGLYQGSSAPSFLVPDYPSELAACQRYYCKIIAGMTLNTNGSPATTSHTAYFPVQMRTAPSGTVDTGAVQQTTIHSITSYQSSIAGSSWYSPSTYFLNARM